MLIVGLGNPGNEYAETFHNCGFCVVDALAKKLDKKLMKIECEAQTCVFQNNGQKIILAKPLTYMNNSGIAVKGLLARYKVDISELVVVYDDIDLPRFSLRARAAGSSGTHNGMRSVVAETGSEKFKRIRVGVGRNPYDLKDYVLSRFSKEDKPKFEETFTRAADFLYDFMQTGDWDKLMREANTDKNA